MADDFRICTVVLEYNGGSRTDGLVAQLRDWNPEAELCVLDNCSSMPLAKCVTHRNRLNSFVGGGVCDSIALARGRGASHVLFIVNDLEFVTPLLVKSFEDALISYPMAVQVSAAVTQDSFQALLFPWMAGAAGLRDRETGHADLLASLLDLRFVDSFGGFPRSKGGWGYAWELAYHAAAAKRAIVVIDSCLVRHGAGSQSGNPRLVAAVKAPEVATVYGQKYGWIPWLGLRRELEGRYARSCFKVG